MKNSMDEIITALNRVLTNNIITGFYQKSEGSPTLVFHLADGALIYITPRTPGLSDGGGDLIQIIVHQPDQVYKSSYD